jgi:hypothetical protein
MTCHDVDGGWLLKRLAILHHLMNLALKTMVNFVATVGMWIALDCFWHGRMQRAMPEVAGV